MKINDNLSAGIGAVVMLIVLLFIFSPCLSAFYQAVKTGASDRIDVFYGAFYGIPREDAEQGTVGDVGLESPMQIEYPCREAERKMLESYFDPDERSPYERWAGPPIDEDTAPGPADDKGPRFKWENFSLSKVISDAMIEEARLIRQEQQQANPAAKEECDSVDGYLNSNGECVFSQVKEYSLEPVMGRTLKSEQDRCRSLGGLPDKRGNCWNPAYEEMARRLESLHEESHTDINTETIDAQEVAEEPWDPDACVTEREAASGGPPVAATESWRAWLHDGIHGPKSGTPNVPLKYSTFGLKDVSNEDPSQGEAELPRATEP